MEKKAEEKKETLCCMEVQSANDNDGRITVAVQVKGSAEDVAGFIVRTLDTLAKHWV